MSLTRFSEKRFPELADALANRVEPVLIYFVFTGRNAWHSTWVSQYSTGCMHSSVVSAKRFCENRRVQGSVFNIEELPALKFTSKKGCLIVTQINSQEPLSAYSAEATEEDVSLGQRKIDAALDNYMVQGAPMLGIALSFDTLSRFWKQHQPYGKPALVLATNDPALDLPRLPKQEFKVLTSASHGGTYLLGWRERKGRSSPKSVRALVDEFSTNSHRAAE